MSTPPPPEQPHGSTPSATRPSLIAGILIGVLVLALVGGGVLGVVKLRNHDDPATGPRSGANASPSAPAEPGGLLSTSPALSAFYDQNLAWSDCSSGDRCATMKVPLDYARPGGRTIDLELLKVPATGERIGSLVVNPGGPGGSGITYAASGAAGWPSAVLSHFDLVGFDPRGVGRSTPLRCLGTA